MGKARRNAPPLQPIDRAPDSDARVSYSTLSPGNHPKNANVGAA